MGGKLRERADNKSAVKKKHEMEHKHLRDKWDGCVSSPQERTSGCLQDGSREQKLSI